MPPSPISKSPDLDRSGHLIVATLGSLWGHGAETYTDRPQPSTPSQGSLPGDCRPQGKVWATDCPTAAQVDMTRAVNKIGGKDHRQGRPACVKKSPVEAIAAVSICAVPGQSGRSSPHIHLFICHGCACRFPQFFPPKHAQSRTSLHTHDRHPKSSLPRCQIVLHSSLIYQPSGI